MRFEKVIPSERLRPYIKYLIISEDEEAQTYKIFPYPGLVLGFQYKGQLSILKGPEENCLSPAGHYRNV